MQKVIIATAHAIGMDLKEPYKLMQVKELDEALNDGYKVVSVTTAAPPYKVYLYTIVFILEKA